MILINVYENSMWFGIIINSELKLYCLSHFENNFIEF